ncbi:MAPEG family protein [Roseobacter sp. N2S]|uniref:MAPEG family protein n=1 Tax=Roseobacter sp. N2S TaxID=2663844 RepID=UPI0028609C5A|nr:MAPEG family protein [Roseobacter sp. N2S]MDR6264335.1 putative MAPEG superfamily protein [Roseobacter sp. N2S]
MTSELSILALYGLLVILVLVVQALFGAAQLGLPYLATARDEGRKLSGMGARVERSLNNSIVALALFAPAVLILTTTSATTANSLLAAQIFLIARVIYAPLYWFAIPWLRTAAWASGFIATIYLYLLAV